MNMLNPEPTGTFACFRKLDESTGYPPHVAQADAERAQARVLATIREHVGENDG